MKNQLTKNHYRLAMINRWKESGKSIKAFCNDEKIVNSTFHYWKKNVPGENKPRPCSAFIKMEPVSLSPASTLFCELITTKGSRLLFHQLVVVAFLKKLL